MKRLFCALIVLALAMTALSGCDRRSEVPEEDAEANFAPETTSVGGLTQAVEDQVAAEPEDADVAPGEEPDAAAETEESPEPAAEDAASLEEAASTEDAVSPDASQEAVQDQPIAADATATPEPSPTINSPFATPTPQPNASVSQYTEISAPGLGFRFCYPTGWINIPGRSTVCYVQPLTDGTVYPARVAVTMKRMPHTTSYDESRTELANYLRNLMTQYDSATFRVNTHLDLETKFMGNRAIGTTYQAYDGDQEIQGYAVITYFDHYMFVFHFLCAYDDYTSFQATLRYMRDSVVADASVAPE